MTVKISDRDWHETRTLEMVDTPEHVKLLTNRLLDQNQQILDINCQLLRALGTPMAVFKETDE